MSGSVVRTATYAAKQYTHDDSDGTSRMRARKAPGWPPSAMSHALTPAGHVMLYCRTVALSSL